MTDPTGRPAREPSLPGDDSELTGERTDLDVHPAVEVPRPFTREALEAEEGQIKDGILRMGSLVAERIIAAIVALENHDAVAATAVIEHDDDVNTMEREVSNLITLTIATQQPVARDLRFLLTLDHVAYDLERMGDYAASVAKQARKLAPQAPIADYVHLPEMGRLAATLVRDVLEAVVEVDAERARQVAQRDDDVDELYHRSSPRSSTSCGPTPPTSIRACASSSRRTTSSVSAIASPTSPRTSSTSPPARSRS